MSNPLGAGQVLNSSVSLPTGTVTFLFSDIEGSTQRWEQHREAMASAVARHDALMRAASEQHGGFVFKTVGDAFCIAFRQPEAAIATALDAQRALNAEDFSSVNGLRVRMALHTGTADERNGDFFGPALNRVARLLGIGHGGQVLVSGTATDLLQGVMPPQSSLRDLGQHRLRDLSRPEQVYQLVASGLLDVFPLPRSLDVLPNNLPRQATSFIGRDDVLAELKTLLAKSQVVTIVGTGGVGKTRAALQIGADLLDGSGDGVWFVDFAPLAGAEYVVPEIASTCSRNRTARCSIRCGQSTFALQHLALIGALRGQPHSSARLIGYVEEQLKAIGLEREPTEQWGYNKLMAALREQLSEAEIEKLAAEGAAWSEDRAVEEALKV